MQRRQFLAGTMAVIVASGVLAAGCSRSTGAEGADAPASSMAQSAETRAQAADSPGWDHLLDGFTSQQVPGVPFAVEAPAGTVEGAAVVPLPTDPAPDWTGYTEVARTSSQDGVPPATIRALLPDGTAFGSRLRAAPTEGARSLEDYAMDAGLIAGTGFTPLSQLAGEPVLLPGSNDEDLYFEPQHASVSGDLVAYREASAGEAGAMPTLDSDDWRLMVWDRGAGTVREVAASSLLRGTRKAPYGSWDVAPTIGGGRVWFDAALPTDYISGLEVGAVLDPAKIGTMSKDDATKWTPTVISIPVDAPGEVRLGGVARLPWASGDGAFMVASAPNVAGALVFSSGEGEAWSLGRSADPAWQPTKLAASDDLLAVTFSDTTVADATTGEAPSAWILVWDLHEKALRYAIDTGSDGAEVSLSGRTLAWGNAAGSGPSGMYLWDAGAGEPLGLGDMRGYSLPYVSGRYVATPESDGSQISWVIRQRP